MLHSLTTSTMLLAMLLHAVFGCHWHHTHATGVHGDCGGGMVVVGCSHHHEHHAHDSREHHDSHGNHAPEAPSHGSGDCGDKCIFLGVPPVVAPTLDMVWTGAVAVDLDADRCHWLAWNISERNRNNLFYGDASPAAQRPILCIWLI